MTDLLIQSLCDAVDGAQLMSHIGELAQWIKLSGSDGEAVSLRTIRGHLDAYGFRTTILLHDAYISLPGKSRVDVDGATPVSITHSFSRSSPPGGLSAELVYVGGGNDADFAGRDVRGRIVLSMALPRDAEHFNDALTQASRALVPPGRYCSRCVT